jgi:hypothetical protein
MASRKKRGRRALPGERYPCGRKRPGEDRGGALWRRIADHGEKLALDPRLGSELGRLRHFGELSNLQASAGSRVGEIYGRYERLKHLHRSTASPSYRIGFGESDDPTGPEELRRFEQRVRRAQRAFLRLQEEIQARDLKALIEEVCVDDRPINPTRLDDLRAMLDHLAVHFGMSDRAPKDTAMARLRARPMLRKRAGPVMP